MADAKWCVYNDVFIMMCLFIMKIVTTTEAGTNVFTEAPLPPPRPDYQYNGIEPVQWDWFLGRFQGRLPSCVYIIDHLCLTCCLCLYCCLCLHYCLCLHCRPLGTRGRAADRGRVPEKPAEVRETWWIFSSKWWIFCSKWWTLHSKWWTLHSKWWTLHSKWWTLHSQWWTLH